MLQLELPHVNVLSKIDLITTYGDLPFNLDFYTEVQDLSYLQHELDKDPRSAKYSELNKAICEIVEDFSLVGFQTLCVEVSRLGCLRDWGLLNEQDKMSMASLVKTIDQMLGCIPRTRHTHDAENGHEGHTHEPETAHQLLYSLPASSFPSTMDIQEKYVDRSKEYSVHERDKWKAEGEDLMRKANELEKKKAVDKASTSTSS